LAQAVLADRSLGSTFFKTRVQNERTMSMNSQITGLRVASVVFGLIALAQFVRLVVRPEVLVAGHPLPLWPSVLAFIVLGGLSLWLWTLARR
jgi:hypothetical protein